MRTGVVLCSLFLPSLFLLGSLPAPISPSLRDFPRDRRHRWRPLQEPKADRTEPLRGVAEHREGRSMSAFVSPFTLPHGLLALQDMMATESPVV